MRVFIKEKGIKNEPVLCYILDGASNMPAKRWKLILPNGIECRVASLDYNMFKMIIVPSNNTAIDLIGEVKIQILDNELGKYKTVVKQNDL